MKNMAKRRRRFKIKSSSSSLFELILINLLLLLCLVEAHHEQLPSEQSLQVESRQQNINNYLKQYNQNHNSNFDLHQQHKSTTATTINQVVASHELQQQQQQQQQQQVGIPSIAHLCSHVLPASSAKYLKLCKLIGHSASADEAVVVGTARGLAECRSQFRWDRWNCTHAHGDHHLLTSRLAQSIGNKESGFVQAIAAAGIVHSIATACSSGALSDCACDKTRIGLIRQKDQIWKWGGCSNNIRHGMMFAKHLVELLDAVHHQQQQQQVGADPHHQHQHQLNHNNNYNGHHHRRLAQHLAGRKLAKRSLSSKHNHQVRASPHNSNIINEQQVVGQSSTFESSTQATLNFCQSNQNISQTTHYQLIKSLLSRNSLEKHQDFRLAMNMHNNKVGRMAVAKNMEIRCRCHGLSGSCSLKTCWLKLPDFQQIGLYLRRKYEASVHLPTAVNVNRLIPMMDRNEISAILSSQSSGQQQHQQQAAHLALSAPPSQVQQRQAAGFEPLVATGVEGGDQQQAADEASLSSATATNTNSNNNQRPALLELTTPVNVPAHYLHYERHKQLEQLAGSATGPSRPPAVGVNGSASGADQAHLISDEIPVNITPMTQNQYQALLKEMKLCNSLSAPQQTATTSYLTTRDLQQDQQLDQTASKHLHKKLQQQQQQQHNHNNNHQISSNGHHLRLANQHLSQLLHAQNNKDELIHLHRSPDYCEPDARHGFAGVRGRVCNADRPEASDGCDRLCCGRGHEKRRRIQYKSCECQFLYCCSIGCKTCAQEIVENVCK